MLAAELVGELALVIGKGRPMGLRERGGNISIRKNGRCTRGRWFRFLGNLWVVVRRLREIVKLVVVA